MDDSNFASLSPTLLARKGGAKPAMRPQLAPLNAGTAAQSLEDLGWNDMGADEEASKSDAGTINLTPSPVSPDMEAEAQEADQQSVAALAACAPEKPEVRRQQEALSNSLRADPEPIVESAPDAEQVAAEPVMAEPAHEPLIAKKAKSKVAETHLRPARKSALQRGKRAAFTLRLDADRHLKLRLACTLRGRSAQQLVTEALDELLGDMADVDSLAAQVSTQN